MQKTKLVGRESYFFGKTLFEISANLKYCEGRVVARKAFLDRYPEKSFYVIDKILPDLTEDNRHGQAWGYKVFRGRHFGKLMRIDSGGKSDWILIPKDEEAEFCKIDKVYEPEKYIPLTHSVPPIFDIIVKREMKALGKPVESEPMMLNSTRASPSQLLWKNIGNSNIKDQVDQSKSE